MDANELAVLQSQKTEDYNKFMQDMTTMIAQVSIRLRGKRYKWVEGVQEEEKIGEPLLNMLGLNYVESKMHSYLNPNLYMAQLKPDEARNNYKLEVITFGMSLLEHKEEYQTKTPNIRQIIGLVCPVFYFALMKACSDKGFVERTSKTGYNTNSSDMQPPMPI